MNRIRITRKEFRLKFKKHLTGGRGVEGYEIPCYIQDIKKDYYVPSKKALCIELLSKYETHFDVFIDYDYHTQYDAFAISLFNKFITDDMIDKNMIDKNIGNTNVCLAKKQ